MHTIHHLCFARPGAAVLGLLALSLPGLLVGCAGDSAEPEGFDVSMRSAQPPGEPECITLAPAADAMLSTPPKHQNYGAHPLLRVGGKDESLLRFDLGSIPAGSSIESASLRLYLNGGAGSNPINIHAATSPWAEGSVTYQSFDQDFDPAVAGVIQPSSPNALKSADLTGLVSSWLLGGQANYGVLLETTGNQKNIFVSREGAAGYRPSLEVCYTEPFVDHCAEDPCQNGGTCENDPGGYTCTCAPGYEGVDCELDIDECAGGPCVNGSCADGIAGYTCACDAGWEGTNCEANIDDCADEPCLNGGICTDGLQGYTCTCDAGYTGPGCEIDIDECADGPCLNGDCTDGINGYSCECFPGFSGVNCELDVDDCVGNACENESTCVDGLGEYDCACLPGFTGTHCEIDIDECEAGPCLNGGDCTDGIDSYDCACPPGYTGVHCEIDIDECESGLCVNGDCVDLVDAYQCVCAPGYTGTNCETEIDECESGPCANGANCLDQLNGFECQCLPGWAGPTCEEYVPQETSCPCSGGAAWELVLTMTPGGTSFEDGRTVYEATLGNDGYVAVLDDFFEGLLCYGKQPSGPATSVAGITEAEAEACTDIIRDWAAPEPVDECEMSPCLNGSRCTDGPGTNDYQCDCAPGYTGTNCETEIDECESGPCANGANCLDQLNGFECQCLPGWAGPTCEEYVPQSSCPCSGGVSWEAVLSMPPGEITDDVDYVYAHSADGNGYLAAHYTQAYCEGLDWTAPDMASFETYHTSLTPAEVEACLDVIHAWGG
jgi:hypothetical protein